MGLFIICIHYFKAVKTMSIQRHSGFAMNRKHIMDSGTPSSNKLCLTGRVLDGGKMALAKKKSSKYCSDIDYTAERLFVFLLVFGGKQI